MAKVKGLSLGAFQKRFSSEGQCQKYLASVRWSTGFACPKCGCRHYCTLSNGLYQYAYAQCRRQTSVTTGTVLHRSHVRLTTWFLAFYLLCQNKRGISAVQLAIHTGVTYKTAWYMLKRIRMAMGQRDVEHRLGGAIEFDAYFGGPTAGEKRGRGTEKAKVFVTLSLDTHSNPPYIKDIHADSLGVDKISDQASAAAAVDVINNAINKVSDIRGTLITSQNCLDHIINNLSVMTENMQNAESTIRDTDVAAEMMKYTKNNILIQSARANQVPQGALQLLQ